MRSFVLAFLILLAAFPSRAEPQSVQDALSAVNEVRRDHGLPSLRLDSQLGRAAQDFARELADWGQLSHKGPNGSNLDQRLVRQGYAYRLAAENLASGMIGPRQTVDLWLESPGHRENMLRPELREAGIGVSRASDGQAYWTLVLGRRMNDRGEAPDLDLGP
ncbi:Allergen V5/Tpx-1 family protein [Rhodospirillaceae bacterium LM-1]|nr:Allergen V5/Tpx-1 family protein [Rhodospirillaceae bacterium LM-1]